MVEKVASTLNQHGKQKEVRCFKKSYATLTEALKDQCTPEVKQQLTDMLIKRAKMGNLKAYELLRDQLGEKPVEKVEHVNQKITIDFGALDDND